MRLLSWIQPNNVPPLIKLAYTIINLAKIQEPGGAWIRLIFKIWGVYICHSCHTKYEWIWRIQFYKVSSSHVIHDNVRTTTTNPACMCYSFNYSTAISACGSIIGIVLEDGSIRGRSGWFYFVCNQFDVGRWAPSAGNLIKDIINSLV